MIYIDLMGLNQPLFQPIGSWISIDFFEGWCLSVGLFRRGYGKHQPTSTPAAPANCSPKVQ